MHYSDRDAGERDHRAHQREFVEPEPGVELVVDPEENQDKQLSMIPCTI